MLVHDAIAREAAGGRRASVPLRLADSTRAHGAVRSPCTHENHSHRDVPVYSRRRPRARRFSSRNLLGWVLTGESASWRYGGNVESVRAIFR